MTKHRRRPHPKRPPIEVSFLGLTFWILSAITILAVALGCATNTGDPRKDRAGRVTNAIGEGALDFVGRVAYQTLANAAGSYAGGEKIDLAHSAAEGLWKESGSIVSSADVQRVINAWSGDKLATVAAAGAVAYRKADPQTPSARAVEVSRIAHTLSEAAFDAAGKP